MNAVRRLAAMHCGEGCQIGAGLVFMVYSSSRDDYRQLARMASGNGMDLPVDGLIQTSLAAPSE